MRVRVEVDFELPPALLRRVVEWYHGPPGMPPFRGDPTEAVVAALESVLCEELPIGTGVALPEAVGEFERAFIERALVREGRLRRAAVRLGIAYPTIKKKVRKYGLGRYRRRRSGSSTRR